MESHKQPRPRVSSHTTVYANHASRLSFVPGMLIEMPEAIRARTKVQETCSLSLAGNDEGRRARGRTVRWIQYRLALE